MSVVFSAEDLARLSQAVQLLVSPLQFESVDAWRCSVNRQIAALIGADSSGFMMPVAEGLYLFSEEHDPAELARYPDLTPPAMRDGTPVWLRTLQHGVGTLAEVYGSDYGIYTDSAYYNEFAAPNDAHDTIFATFPIGGPEPGASTGVFPSLAALQFWHASPRRRAFGRHETAMLGILMPAFRAGVEAQLRLGGERARLFAVIDDLGEAMRLCDACGAVVHETPRLRTLLSESGDAGCLESALACAIRSAALALRADGSVSSLTGVQRTISTSVATYQIGVTVQRAGYARGDFMILGRVVRTTAIPLDDAELRRKWALTRAQSRVARLIAMGLSNDQIASELCISPHTARRHTERVLEKLGAHSRAEVARHVLR